MHVTVGSLSAATPLAPARLEVAASVASVLAVILLVLPKLAVPLQLVGITRHLLFCSLRPASASYTSPAANYKRKMGGTGNSLVRLF